MPVYSYIAHALDMAEASGTITADTPHQARQQLRDRGLIVRQVDTQKAEPRSFIDLYLTRRQAPKVVGLLQELSTLLSAGIPLLETLDTITRQHTGRFKRCILLLRDRVAAGGSLAEAMADQPLLFDSLCVNIAEVGENAGTLDEALSNLVKYKERSARLKNRVATAMMYPCIVMLVGVVVSIFLMTFVVPNLLSTLVAAGKPLPAATVIVKAMSDILIHQWWVLLLGVGIILTSAITILRTSRGRHAWHRVQLNIPLVGELIRKQSIARMSLVMATLLGSGLVFVKAVQIAQRSVRNSVLRDALIACENAVVAGRDIADALEKTGAFPPLVIQVFAVGQASGNLDAMLTKLANDYDQHVDLASQRLTALLEPLMMILLAIGVGFIAFAAILPILEASDVL